MTAAAARPDDAAGDPVRDAAGGDADLAGDDRVIRRATRAGLLTAAGVSAVTVLANVAFGGDATAAAIWVASSAVLGSLVTAGWLVLSVILDLAAGQTPSRRRIVWTAVAFAVAFVAPIVPAAMLTAAAA